ncbi:MAG: DUF4292 domain-containing protein [Myxococcales bacterium]|nr:MAG: DUF4292 domain-containing protein [Myxococcales bacterium]
MIRVLFFVLSCALLGCGARSCPSKSPRSVKQALQLHQSMHAYLSSLRAEARVEQYDRHGRIKGTVMMFVMRPDRVRFDMLTQFGPAAILTSKGPSFQFSDFKAKKFSSGLTCPGNIARLIGMNLSAEELGKLLFAEVPEMPAARTSMMCTSEGYYRLMRYSKDGRRQEIDFDVRGADRDKSIEEQRLRLVRIELYDSQNRRQWKVLYDEYKVLSLPGHAMGIAMPHRVEFFDGYRGSEVLLKFKKIDLNVSIESTIFDQEARPGMTLEENLCE